MSQYSRAALGYFPFLGSLLSPPLDYKKFLSVRFSTNFLLPTTQPFSIDLRPQSRTLHPSTLLFSTPNTNTNTLPSHKQTTKNNAIMPPKVAKADVADSHETAKANRVMDDELKLSK